MDTTDIVNAIKNYFINIEQEDYIKPIKVNVTDGIYKITLIQGCDDRPINIYIEADTNQECIDKILKELRSRYLTSVRYGTLYKIK